MAGPPNLGMPIPAVSSNRPARFSIECSRGPEDPPSGPWSIMRPLLPRWPGPAAPLGDDDSPALLITPTAASAPFADGEGLRSTTPPAAVRLHFGSAPAHISRNAAEAIRPTSGGRALRQLVVLPKPQSKGGRRK
jgi:hypothetical protein